MLQEKLQDTSVEIGQAVEKAVALARGYAIGKEATFKKGKYVGRKGRCTEVVFDSYNKEMVFLIRPYRVRGRHLGTMDDFMPFQYPDARTFWRLKDIEFIEQ